MMGVPAALALLLVLLTAALFWRRRAAAAGGGAGASSRPSAVGAPGGGGGGGSAGGGAAGAPLRKVTAAELARHNTEHDVWLAIDGRVYDFSSYIDLHPGGLRDEEVRRVREGLVAGYGVGRPGGAFSY